MRPKNKYIIRPLIEMSRADILHYLADRHLSFREDKSNTDSRYLRNKVRHELIPFLEKGFQPQVRKLLAETATLLGEDYALLTSIPSSLPLTQTPSETAFSCQTMLALPLPLIQKELRALLRPLLKGKNPDKNLIFELIKAIKSNKSKSQTLSFRGLKFIRKGDRVRLLNF
jgi:tRNA(Ile)-lysidine synthase